MSNIGNQPKYIELTRQLQEIDDLTALMRDEFDTLIRETLRHVQTILLARGIDPKHRAITEKQEQLNHAHYRNSKDMLIMVNLL